MPRSNPSRPRRRNRWQALSSEELQAQAAEQRALGAGGPLPWQPHPSLLALQDRLQLVADCWNLLDGTDGQSRRGLYLPQGSKEPEAAYRQRLANARPSGFYRDALRTYAGMLASVQWRELPGWLAGVLSDVDGLGTDFCSWPTCWCCQRNTAGRQKGTGKRRSGAVIGCPCRGWR